MNSWYNVNGVHDAIVVDANSVDATCENVNDVGAFNVDVIGTDANDVDAIGTNVNDVGAIGMDATGIDTNSVDIIVTDVIGIDGKLNWTGDADFNNEGVKETE